MMQSAPFITPVEPEPVTTSFVQSQIPLVQSTQILTQQQSVLPSTIISTPSVVPTTPAYAVPQASYAPVVSSVPAQPTVHTGVKVVPIYDDF